MQLRQLLPATILVLFCLIGMAQPYRQLPDGVQLRVHAGNIKAVKISVISEKIIRVQAAADTLFPATQSLMVLPGSRTAPWKLRPGKDSLQLQTAALIASISLRTGAVSVRDKAGRPIVSEAATDGRSLQPVTIEGKPLYQLSQHFSMSPNEAFYGLGQHQTGRLNLRGESVTLLQQNTDVAVPFLVSTRGYGILWDNYSITRAGDTRAYQPLRGLQLFDSSGQPGGLTATYRIKDSAAPFLVRQEQQIEYKYLNDLPLLPAGYNLAKGTVDWQGWLAAADTGLHRFFLFYSTYTKIWIDDSLVVDRWRQNWNPGQVRFDIAFAAGQWHKIKIAWQPLVSEAAISLQYLPPASAAQQNQFGFHSEAGEAIDYYLCTGSNIDEIIGGYRQLTGKATLLPQWALGFWQSRERYKTQQELMSTVAGFRRRHIGLDNIVQDWSYWPEDQWGSHDFEASRFPHPQGMIDSLHRLYHAHFMISVWPKFYPQTAHYQAMNAKGYLYKGNIQKGRLDWIGKGYLNTFYDAYNPGARQLFWQQMNRKLYSKGVDAWWMDASEPDIHSNVNIADRKDFMTPTFLGPSTQYFNGFALQNAKGIYEGQRSVGNNRRVFTLTRSAFGGLQRYAAATWSGDIAARWHDMKDQIAAGLGFSLSGLPWWTMDIGGFATEQRYNARPMRPADEAEWQELQTRWYQFGAFVPLFRSHGQYPFREMYNVAPDTHPAYQSMLYYNRLRYRLMPYIASLAGQTYWQHYTLMRALVMDFPEDATARNCNDEYLFGPSLLICPVSEYKATRRPVYLPQGNGWYDAYTGQYHNGGQTIAADAPYERMPLFVKAGSIVPLGPAVEWVGQHPADTITLLVYTGSNAQFTLYEDDGLTYHYEKGAYSNIPISYNEKSGAVTIGPRKGNFPEMLAQRVFRVKWITPQRPAALAFEGEADAVVRYSGKAVTLSKKNG